ncbi:MFS transporter [Streptomyces xiaopingdaonensis]|uniref:MFS transporter n=1 Tax=Streptomyces xiaopingdaonensis TaxID=1565415 RepID=UPI000305A289|nr:MFS transporter [Streptomyces xiaopingdaonensis]
MRPRTRPRPRTLLGRTPLAGRYPAAVALSLLALCPYLVLTTATTLMEPLLLRELHATRFGLQLATGLSNAAYAFGAVAAADIVQRVPRRHVYLVCECGFVAGCVLVLCAQGAAVFVAGMVLQGLVTGMLLVAALPPLVTGHGTRRLPTTAAVISLGLFGMATCGPLVGGLVGAFGGWRLLFAALAVLALVGVTIGALAFEPNQPPAQGAAFDWLAIPLALGATLLPFFGVSWLTRGSFTDLLFLVPVAFGLLLGAALVAGQYHAPRPLMPVRPISNTLPVAGMLGAMTVGAVFTALVELTEGYLVDVARASPLQVGLLLAPQLPGVVVAALLFRRLLPTAGVPLLALSGLAGVAAAGAVLLTATPSDAAVVVPVAALLLGYGAGAGVAPGLFMAGLSVPSTQIGPTFALVELLRSEAAFLVGPVLLRIADAEGLAGGFRLAVGASLVLTVLGGALIVGVYLLGGARLRRPDLSAWIAGESTAYHSPRLGARLRKG